MFKYAHPERPVADVCSGQTGDEESADPDEESLRVVPRERLGGVQAAIARPADRAAVDQSARRARRSILSIRTGREDRDIRDPVEHRRGRERHLEVPSALSGFAPERDRRLASREDRFTAMEPRRLGREPPAGQPRFAVEPARQKARPEPESASLPKSAFQPDSIRRDHAGQVAAPTANGRPRADESGAVPRDVGEDEGDQSSGRRPSELPSLDGRERRSQPIDTVDWSSRADEPRDGPLLSTERHSRTRQTEERRSSSGDEAEDQVFPPESRKEIERGARRPHARGIGLRVRGEEDRDARPARPRITSREHDERGPARLPRGREHPGGRLPDREKPDSSGARESF